MPPWHHSRRCKKEESGTDSTEEPEEGPEEEGQEASSDRFPGGSGDHYHALFKGYEEELAGTFSMLLRV